MFRIIRIVVVLPHREVQVSDGDVLLEALGDVGDVDG